MNRAYILGVETTCDETAMAILDENCEIVSHVVSSQLDHAEYGGVVPELAARAHLDSINKIFQQLFDQVDNKISPQEICAIGCSTRPGLLGGVLVGTMFSKAFASARQIPFISIDHLEAHILLPLMFAAQTSHHDYSKIFPSLVLLISGGHCQMIALNGIGNYKSIGRTLDDSIGETFDKVAKMLGLGYPGGPAIELCAKDGNELRFKLPESLCGLDIKHNTENATNFSFSGLKTAMKLLIEKLDICDRQIKADICASFQYTISNILIHKINIAIKLSNKQFGSIIISGGVAANNYIRGRLHDAFSMYDIQYAPSKYCTDNGVMIAYNTLLKYKRGQFEPLDCAVLPYSELFVTHRN